MSEFSGCTDFELLTKSYKEEWTFNRIYKLGRRSYHGFPADGGIRMECERLAAKVTKGIPLIENDIRYLERLEKTK